MQGKRIKTKIEIHADTQNAHRKIDRLTHRETERQRGRQIDRHADKHNNGVDI